MACKNVCTLCDNLVISQTVTFAANTLTVNIPAGDYANGQKYCIVIAQSIPATATIAAPVVITIGAGTTEYPLVNKCGNQVTACSLKTRTKYSTVVCTNATGGSFKLLGKVCCAANNPAVINGG